MSSKAEQAAEAVLDGILDAPIKVKVHIILLIIGVTIFPKWREWADAAQQNRNHIGDAKEMV